MSLYGIISMSFLTFLVIFLVIIFIFSFAIVGSCRYVPYSKDIMSTNKYNREAFHNLKNEPLGYASASNHQYMDDLKNQELQSSPNSCSCRKISGFNGLFCDSNKDPNNPVDIYSTAQGSSECKSYGYHNSRGFLCLDDNQKRLLTTRGGNASG